MAQDAADQAKPASRKSAKIQFPAKLQVLFQPSRYKIVYGGRGKGASWNIARALLIQGAQKPLRILCCREIQNSIDDSVYKLLVDQIGKLGLGNVYQILKTEITAVNGTQIGFHGLRHKIDSIKSAEGIDIVWVSEARTVSKDSWNKLIPTVRKDGSEIWVDFNPELDTDETYRRFVVNPPPSAQIVFMTWRDNPWFPQVLREEMATLRMQSEDDYLHVYEGHTKKALEGAVFKDELRTARSEGRICRIPVRKDVPVHVFVDLGFGDNTSLWFMQKVGLEYHFIHTYQNRLKLWPHYLEYIQKTGYIIHTVWLPHDGAADNVRGKSPEEVSRAAAFKVKVVERVAVKTRIDAGRAMMAACWFDEEECADGLQALHHYVWENSAGTKKNPEGVATREPLHNEHSHYADAFQVFGVGFKEGPGPSEKAEAVAKKLKRVINLDLRREPGSWMGH